MSLQNYHFDSPIFLFLLLVLPILTFYYYKKHNSYFPELTFSDGAGFEAAFSWKEKARHLVQLLQLFAIASTIITLARPQAVLTKENVTNDGIDIILAMDVSTSMLAMDFEPDRLEAAKRVAKNFVNNRKQDRIGLVIFAGESFTQCPLTTDHQILNNFIENTQCGLIENGTAIGMGLANAVKRLKESTAKSKIVILLTDGVNNAGYASPSQAAKVAEKEKIKVYTIGIGSNGQARTPVAQKFDGSYVYDWQLVNIDEALLNEIAQKTGGKYFRAKDMQELEAVYAEIDRLETSEIESNVVKRYKDLFHPFLWAALFFTFLQLTLSITLFKSIV